MDLWGVLKSSFDPVVVEEPEDQEAVLTESPTVAVRKDDVSAAIHAAKANVAGLGSISGCGGFIQTTSG